MVECAGGRLLEEKLLLKGEACRSEQRASRGFRPPARSVLHICRAVIVAEGPPVRLQEVGARASRQQ